MKERGGERLGMRDSVESGRKTRQGRETETIIESGRKECNEKDQTERKKSVCDLIKRYQVPKVTPVVNKVSGCLII